MGEGAPQGNLGRRPSTQALLGSITVGYPSYFGALAHVPLLSVRGSLIAGADVDLSIDGHTTWEAASASSGPEGAGAFRVRHHGSRTLLLVDGQHVVSPSVEGTVWGSVLVAPGTVVEVPLASTAAFHPAKAVGRARSISDILSHLAVSSSTLRKSLVAGFFSRQQGYALVDPKGRVLIQILAAPSLFCRAAPLLPQVACPRGGPPPLRADTAVVVALERLQGLVVDSEAANHGSAWVAEGQGMAVRSVMLGHAPVHTVAISWQPEA